MPRAAGSHDNRKLLLQTYESVQIEDRRKELSSLLVTGPKSRRSAHVTVNGDEPVSLAGLAPLENSSSPARRFENRLEREQIGAQSPALCQQERHDQEEEMRTQAEVDAAGNASTERHRIELHVPHRAPENR
jgi:hypothetical protein